MKAPIHTFPCKREYFRCLDCGDVAMQPYDMDDIDSGYYYIDFICPKCLHKIRIVILKQ